MKHYDYTKYFRDIYDKAAKLYAAGQRGAGSYFTHVEADFLASIGASAQDMYDYAEDFTNYGEPDYDTALAIQFVRRDYFVNDQGGVASTLVLDEAKMPPKSASVQGIEWLPRIIPKARAKLRGELPSNLMYGCGGDRKFFKAYDIHPAEFLSLVWRNENDDGAIINWVAARSVSEK